LKKATKWVIEDAEHKGIYWPSAELKNKAWVSDTAIYAQADKDPPAFWAKLAGEGIDWYRKWRKVYEEKPPHFKWFIGGKLNASYNCLDRHINTWRRNKAAIIWEPETTGARNRVLTYYDLYLQVNKFANVLKSLGVGKGDRVVIYLPMIPEVNIVMLACTRIGAIHSVVFSAFSHQALNDRIKSAEPKIIVTADGYYRDGQPVNLKPNVDEAVAGTNISQAIIIKETGKAIKMIKGRDLWWHELMAQADNYCEPEVMDSEDQMFILYTSGTTGKPKGVIHTTGGYMTQAYWTTKWDFDLHDEDVFWCTADIGWITGHTYNCYGPLACGATMVMYEGAPDYPQPDRWWQIVAKYGVTILYTAPTAIRMFKQYGDEWPAKHDLSTLRILGTVGEPIDRAAWMWFFEHIGGSRCPIIDTWWQTETGGILINALPGIGPHIPTVAGRSFPGIRLEVFDEAGKPLPPGENGYLVGKSPFAPGLLRGIHHDPKRYREQYFVQYGNDIYFTNDGAIKDEMGNFRLTGRVDDVIKVAGHRLTTAEVENAITSHPSVTESAVVPIPDDIKGQVPLAFAKLKAGVQPSRKLAAEIIERVDKTIGPTCRPARVLFVSDLPKTRSGKTLRRVLKNLISNQPIGNITTIANPQSIEELKKSLASEANK